MIMKYCLFIIKNLIEIEIKFFNTLDEKLEFIKKLEN